MKGLELSKGYFENFGKPMLESGFPDILPYLAAGFVGSGSEHYGFDDDVSQDHDFEPGFCIFIPGEDIIDEHTAFRLERAYAGLPKEYMGAKRQSMSPVGGTRNGVIRISDFYERAVGAPDGMLTCKQWLTLPDYALAEAVNGEVFFDNYGEFSRIREGLRMMPGDIRLKRIAGNLLLMSQSGQYNYTRCIKHREYEAAQLACCEFVNASIKTAFLLHERCAPYYKWSFRALRQLEGCDDLADKLAALLSGNIYDPEETEAKYYLIEDIASDIIDELQNRGLTKAVCGDLEKHAYSVNDGIHDGELRNMHILTAV